MPLARGLFGPGRNTATRGAGPYSVYPTIEVTSNTLAQIDTPVTYTHAVVTAGVASSTALAANTSAVYRLIVNNDSTNPVWLMFGATAVANEGLPLWPGQRLEMSLQQGNLSTEEINCISGAATVLLVTEGVPS